MFLPDMAFYHFPENMVLAMLDSLDEPKEQFNHAHIAAPGVIDPLLSSAPICLPCFDATLIGPNMMEFDPRPCFEDAQPVNYQLSAFADAANIPSPPITAGSLSTAGSFMESSRDTTFSRFPKHESPIQTPSDFDSSAVRFMHPFDAVPGSSGTEDNADPKPQDWESILAYVHSPRPLPSSSSVRAILDNEQTQAEDANASVVGRIEGVQTTQSQPLMNQIRARSHGTRAASLEQSSLYAWLGQVTLLQSGYIAGQSDLTKLTNQHETNQPDTLQHRWNTTTYPSPPASPKSRCGEDCARSIQYRAPTICPVAEQLERHLKGSKVSSRARASCGKTFSITCQISLRPRAGTNDEEVFYPCLSDKPFNIAQNDGPTPRDGMGRERDRGETIEEESPSVSPPDLYAPRFTRRGTLGREGWCSLCTQGGWYSMKRSQYLYHLQYDHGISSQTRREFSPPAMLRIWNDGVETTEGLCHECDAWIPICFGPVRKRDFKAWFKHAHKCHYVRAT